MEGLNYSKDEMINDPEKQRKAERAMSAYVKMLQSLEYQKAMKRYS